MRIVYLATDPLTAYRLMDGQLAFLRTRGFDVTLITSPGPLLQLAGQREGVRVTGIPMRREISPLADALALGRLVHELKRIKPTIVNAGTPKAGLLGVMAARLAGVPVVVYLLRGLRFEGARGSARLLLAGSEHVAGTLAHRVFVNSQSLRDRFTALGCAPVAKTWVPAHGSSNGIELSRFAPSEERRRHAQAERARLGIPGDAIVAGFVGRFTRDKGILELCEAFRRAVLAEPRLRLLLVGDHDRTDPLPEDVRHFVRDDPRITGTGFVDEPAPYYPLMDYFVFPSLREGFPNAPLEAAAAGLPVLAFAATGSKDAVVDGETGSLLAVGDVAGLSEAMVRYARDPELRRAHGSAGVRRVTERFDRQVVWQAIEAEYRRLAARI